ncbi:uncharacterized protein LOC135834632 [Planococcus citri]|uniref:uncharacterized protein LOC135834632 n=1 Tax=Planococcus citri TaxID=170843 RepID=UPI0031F8B94F
MELNKALNQAKTLFSKLCNIISTHQVCIILSINLMWSIYVLSCKMFDFKQVVFVKVLEADSPFSKRVTEIFTVIESIIFLYVIIAVIFQTWWALLHKSSVIKCIAIMLTLDVCFLICLIIDVYFENTNLKVLWMNEYENLTPRANLYFKESYTAQMITLSYWTLSGVLSFKLISAIVMFLNVKNFEEFTKVETIDTTTYLD